MPTTHLIRPAGLSRRRFLAGTVTTAAATAAALTVGTKLAFATPETPSSGDVIIAIFLRGGADGLSLVAPYAMPTYQTLRPTIRLKSPSEIDPASAALPLVAGGNVGSFALDGVMGMHPGLAALHDGPWAAGNLAIVHAAGMPATESDTRSHFDSQKNWEVGSASDAVGTGFLDRYLATLPGVDRLDAVGLGDHLQRSLSGPVPAFSMDGPQSFNVSGFSSNTRARNALVSLYDAGTTDMLLTTGANTLGAIGLVGAIDWTQPAFQPQNGASYGNSDLGQALQQVAMLIRGDVGLRAAAVDIGGWDTHDGMGQPEDPDSSFRQRAASFGSALAAFATDLGSALDEVTVVTLSEFGRTINENGSGGTDHGRGSVQFIMGGSVRGGVYGSFVDQVVDGPEGDLTVLNDYRRSLSEVLSVRGASTALSTVFPTYGGDSAFGLAAP